MARVAMRCQRARRRPAAAGPASWARAEDAADAPSRRRRDARRPGVAGRIADSATDVILIGVAGRRRGRQRRDVAHRAARRAAVPGPVAAGEPRRRRCEAACACRATWATRARPGPPARGGTCPAARCRSPWPALLSLAVLSAAAVFAARQAAGRRRRRGLASTGRPERLTVGQGGHRPRGSQSGPAWPAAKIAVDDVGVRLGRADTVAGIPLACSRRGLGRGAGGPAPGQDIGVHHPLAAHWPGPRLRHLDPPRRAAEHRDPAAGTGAGRGDGADRDDRLARRAAPGDPAVGLRVFDKAHARADVMVTVGKTAGSRRQQRRRLLRDERHQPARRLAARRRAVRRDRRATCCAWAFDERDDAPIRILATTRHAADGTAAMLDAAVPAAARHHPRLPVDHRADRGRRRCWPRPPARCSCPPPGPEHRPRRVPARGRHLLPAGLRAARLRARPDRVRVRRRPDRDRQADRRR